MHEERLKKLEKIKALGVIPYVERFERTHTSREASALAEKGLREVEVIAKKPKNDVKLAGRIMTLREHGKLVFAQLQDQEGRIQICWMKDFTPDDQFEFIKLLDLGDFVGLTGELFTTKHGETTLLISDCKLLSKSLRPLPEKWHGLKDQEDKYRQRYLDLAMDRAVRERFEFRSRLLRKLREFYWSRGFVEIETPVLENISSGATAKPFMTHHNALDMDVFLRIAAGELWQKMAVVGGYEKTFEVARCFRNEGMDPSHLQEFTMVEHYAAYWNYEDNMNFTEELFGWLLKELLGSLKVTIKDPEGNPREVDFTPPWPRMAFFNLIKKDSGIDALNTDNPDELRKMIRAKKIAIDGMDSMGYGGLVDHLYKKVSRPKLVQPTFVIRHPKDMKPLARLSDDDPRLCDTFQLLVSGWEVINAYGEIVDPLDQRSRFEVQASAKAGGDEEAMSMNEDFLRAMEHGMPPMSGWGLGIDRLVTLLTQQDNLKDVVLFPLMRPQQPDVILSEAKRSEESHPSQSLPKADHGGDSSATPQNDKRGLRMTGDDDGKHINVGLSYAAAKKLVDEHIQDPAIRGHLRESEVVLRGLAKRLGADEEAWGILGLLHDIDYQQTKKDIMNHGRFCEPILQKAGMTPEAIEVIKSHVYGVPGHPWQDMRRSRLVEYALACGETVTGLIFASALVRPDKKLADVEVKSVKKKFKEKSFAAGVNRDVLMECEKIGLTIDELLEIALNAIKEIAGEVGI